MTALTTGPHKNIIPVIIYREKRPICSDNVHVIRTIGLRVIPGAALFSSERQVTERLEIEYPVQDFAQT